MKKEARSNRCASYKSSFPFPGMVTCVLIGALACAADGRMINISGSVAEGGFLFDGSQWNMTTRAFDAGTIVDYEAFTTMWHIAPPAVGGSSATFSWTGNPLDTDHNPSNPSAPADASFASGGTLEIYGDLYEQTPPYMGSYNFLTSELLLSATVGEFRVTEDSAAPNFLDLQGSPMAIATVTGGFLMTHSLSGPKLNLGDQFWITVSTSNAQNTASPGELKNFQSPVYTPTGQGMNWGANLIPEPGVGGMLAVSWLALAGFRGRRRT